MITTCHGQHDARNLGEVCRAILLLGIILISSSAMFAQVETATVSGVITEQSGGAVVGAEVRVTNADTNVTSATTSNQSGIYLVTGLKPGRYRIKIEKQGFKGIDLTDLVLNVQDSVSRNFTLQIGSMSESITVEASALSINTADGSVSTVVDQTYIQNMPLNGRSFQDLILLTPGVVTSSPQNTNPVGNINSHGEFSVNGQRTESNYYTVDGVSADVGIRATGDTRVAISGSLPASTSLGTTQALVSLDALEEFRVQSSTYSAEYGRNPGGQFSFATRSGANQWHGSAFDYLRNDVFDANDWFNNLNGNPRIALRQNDFGGTLGGPIEIPRLYEGKDKTFFFFSYEGLRLTQPHPVTPGIVVPDLCMRGQAASCPSGRMPAPSALQPVVNAFPLPNCTSANPSCINPGNGLAGFLGTWVVPGQLDSTSVRFDHTFTERLRLFFRFSDTSSMVQSRDSFNPATVRPQAYTTRTYTLGATSAISNRVSNEFRLNYSSNEATFSNRSSTFEGAQAVNLAQLQGADPAAYPFFGAGIDLFFFPYSTEVLQDQSSSKQRQWNLIDTVGLSHGRHQFKFGVDVRRLSPIVNPNTPRAVYFFFGESAVEANSVTLGVGFNNASARPIYFNSSAFVQDEWRLTPRLSLSLGLRWEVNPAPGGAANNRPFTVEGSSVDTFTLAPQGTPLWNTTWYNFAPRLGAAYIVRNSPGLETIVRGGGGVFFDTGQQVGSFGFMGPGFSQMARFGTFGGSPASFPVPFSQINPPIVNPPVPPINETMYAYAPHLQLPYTLQWNASIQQSLGNRQALTVSYVGSTGRRLLEYNEFSGVNSNFPDLIFVSNRPTSNYNSLQVQFQRRLTRGLTALGSYTWSHSIDFGSTDFALPITRGNSDFDVRHNFSGALSYDLPNPYQNGLTRAALHNWGLDQRFTARTSFPVTLSNANTTVVDPVTGLTFEQGVDLVPGVPIYLNGSQYPGGRSINPAAFAAPASTNVGNAPRNFARGFGAWQLDMAVRREFPIYERLKLQFRAEAFNVFNHPSFGMVDGQFGQAKFGQATATLAQSVGILSPLYQTGGPRSMQFTLKLAF